MANETYDLGFVPQGGRKDQKAFMEADGTTGTDSFRFRTGTVPENVFVSAGYDSTWTRPFALSLFRDTNGTKVLDNGDTAVRTIDDTPDTGDSFETMGGVRLTQGTYFARIRYFTPNNFDYLLTVRREKTGSASPLATPEIPLGTITQDLRKTDRVNNNDTADNFAFTLDGKSSLNIGVKELGNLSGDVNVRVVRDFDKDGIVDKNEIVAKGVSSLKGNMETISGLRGAGDYILQVCQSKGNTNFEVKFDHSAA
jgi:hypothetical protein